MHAIVDAASVTSRGDAAAMVDTATALLPGLAVGLVAGVAIGVAMARIRRRTRHAIPAGHHDELLERTRLLRKPFEMEPLISTIRDLLAEFESGPAAGRRGG